MYEVDASFVIFFDGYGLANTDEEYSNIPSHRRFDQPRRAVCRVAQVRQHSALVRAARFLRLGACFNPRP